MELEIGRQCWEQCARLCFHPKWLHTHLPWGSLLWLPPTPIWTQRTVLRDPKAKSKHTLSLSSHRSRGALGWGCGP